MPKHKLSGIYCYTNTSNGKRYIGQSIDLERRHRKMDYSNSRMFKDALDKYGVESFEYEVLEYCQPSDLSTREKYWISYYETFPPSLGKGYNLTSGGETYEVSESTRKILSERRKGRKTPKGSDSPLYGIRLTQEHKDRISESKRSNPHPIRGKRLPSDWANRISAGMLGSKNTLGKKMPNSTSRFFGVRWVKHRSRWEASVKMDYVRTYIGRSKDEVEAAKMYDEYVKANNLPHPLNFPE